MRHSEPIPTEPAPGRYAMDLVYLAITIAFFAASFWFVRACASLAQEEKK